ncbi:MAG TPA: hypothetical protein DCE78_12850 [Bacteroidetes bacterium]|nr:hypothetical protein [Bacteroidota bacterium]
MYNIKYLQNNPMKNLSLKILLIFSLTLLIGLQACSEEEVAEERQDPIVVEGIEAVVSEQSRFVTYSGTLEPWKQMNVGSSNPGRIDRIFVQEGDHVQVGDPLIQMEDNQLRQARINYETTKREYERLVPLHEQGAVTRQQLEMAQTEYENAEINLGVLEDNTQLRSKVDGIVTEKWFEEGELYSASPSEAGSPGIIQVMQLNPLKLMVNVNESMLRFINEGQPVSLTVDALPDMEFDSEINRVFPTINPQNRSFRVEVLVDNTEGNLRPGMFSRASLETQKIEGLFVPREALIRGTSANTQDVIFLIDDENQAVRQVVSVGVFLDQMVLIESGLESNQFVVIKGKQRLESGMKVERETYRE